jgi:hypothetical protein
MAVCCEYGSEMTDLFKDREFLDQALHHEVNLLVIRVGNRVEWQG